MCRVMAGLPPREAMGVSSRTEVPLKLSARRDMAATLLGFVALDAIFWAGLIEPVSRATAALRTRADRPVPDGASADCASVPTGQRKRASTSAPPPRKRLRWRFRRGLLSRPLPVALDQNVACSQRI